MKGLFVGLNTIDLQFMVKESSVPNTKIKAENYCLHVGGPATNAAVAFAHLGGNATLLTSIGQHQFTNLIKSELNILNIN